MTLPPPCPLAAEALDGRFVERSPFEPRDYQEDDVREAMEKHAQTLFRLIALIYGVGGGKTPTSLMLAALWLLAGFYTHVVVIVTQDAIAHQFASYGKEGGRFGGRFIYQGENRGFPKPYVNGPATGQQLRHYLESDNNTGSKGAPVFDRMIVVHSSTFLHEVFGHGASRGTGPHSVERALQEGKRILFIVDEGHHAHVMDKEELDDEDYGKANTQISKALAYLHGKRYDFLELKLTGTPYRSDNKTVVSTQETHRINRRLVRLMLDGWAPERIVSEYVEVPGDYDVAAKMLVDQWVRDGKPSVLIRIKPRNKDINREAIEAFTRAFHELGAHVVDSTLEVGAENLKMAIEQDAAGELASSAVFLSISRMVEGVDIRSLTHAYFWGVPRSMLILEQILGRIMRQRMLNGKLLVNCPLEWANKSKAVFFFGNAIDRNGDKDDEHTRLVLRACIFLSLFEHPRWLARQLLGIDDGLPGARPSKKPEVSIIDPAELTQALVALKVFAEEWSKLVNAPLSFSPAKNPEKFEEVFRTWYHDEWLPNYAAEDEVVLSDEVLRDALTHLGRRRQEVRRSMLEGLGIVEDEIVADVIDEMLPDVRAALYSEGSLRFGGNDVERLSAAFVKSLTERVGNGPKTVADVVRRAETFAKIHWRWPRQEDPDNTNREKPVSFGYYAPLLKALGFADIGEAVCFSRPNPRELLTSAWALANAIVRHPDSRVADRKEELEKLWSYREDNPFAFYYADFLLKGIDIGWDEPPEGVPLKMLLDTLHKVRTHYPTKAKMIAVKRAALESGFDGVRALVSDEGMAAA